MNVINLNPVIQSLSSTKLRSTQQAERQTIKLNSTVSNGQEHLDNRQNQSIRVIKVATDGIKVAEFGTNKQNVSNGQSSLQRKPTEQYQSNQQLLERDEIGDLLGIDLFA